MMVNARVAPASPLWNDTNIHMHNTLPRMEDAHTKNNNIRSYVRQPNFL